MRDPSVPATMQWRETKGRDHKPVASLYNVQLGILAMKIICRHDMFRDLTIISIADDPNVHEVKPFLGELTDAALLMLRDKFDKQFGFDPTDKFILDAVKTLAFQNCFDPILDLLAEAQAAWDGVNRLDTWTTTYLKCKKDTPLNRAIGRKVLIAACRRARVPGCKFDNITTLESEEGWDKSTAIRILAGDQFFSDQSILGASDKEVQEQLTGIWMHESADLTGLKKADVDHVKAFASRQWDRARPAYGRVLEKRPRRSIPWGSTNDEEYLQSQTGNRRFWPIAVGRIDIAALQRDRLQLLGEAAYYESKGESLVLDESLWPDAKAEQEKRRVKHPWEDILANIPEVTNRYDDIDFPGIKQTVRIIHTADDGAGFVRQEVSSADILAYVLRIPIAQQQRHHTMTLSAIMKLVGWGRPDSKRVTINGKQVLGYCRRVSIPDEPPF